jgi:hypothetical protein
LESVCSLDSDDHDGAEDDSEDGRARRIREARRAALRASYRQRHAESKALEVSANPVGVPAVQALVQVELENIRPVTVGDRDAGRPGLTDSKHCDELAAMAAARAMYEERARILAASAAARQRASSEIVE